MVTPEKVSKVLQRHLPVYRWREPAYQTAMLSALSELWTPECGRILDVGGGTGVIAQAVSELFPVSSVTCVDVEDRYLPGLSVRTEVFDGRRLPFDDASFDAVLFNNVLHHVEPGDRLPLLKECRRVAPRGPVFIKDHLTRSKLDDLRLFALDALGNVPFHGMVKARYLSGADWTALAEAAGYAIDHGREFRYRGAVLQAVFPNSLEIMMRWTPMAAA